MRDRVPFAFEPAGLANGAIEVDIARSPHPVRVSHRLTNARDTDRLASPPAQDRSAEPVIAPALAQRLRSMKPSTSSSVNRTCAPMRTHGNLPAFTSRSTVSVDSRR